VAFTSGRKRKVSSRTEESRVTRPLATKATTSGNSGMRLRVNCLALLAERCEYDRDR
jgi:hypothetical protein